MVATYKQNQTRKRPQFARRCSWLPCFATNGLRVRKELDSAERAKKVSAKSKRRGKSYVHFSLWTRPQPKSLDFGHLPVANSKGEPNFRIFSNSRCWRIWTRIGAYENQHLKLFFGVVVIFFIEVGSDRKQKTENINFSKLQICPKMSQHHPKEQKKTSRVTLGTFFGRPNPESA